MILSITCLFPFYCWMWANINLTSTCSLLLITFSILIFRKSSSLSSYTAILNIFLPIELAQLKEIHFPLGRFWQSDYMVRVPFFLRYAVSLKIAPYDVSCTVVHFRVLLTGCTPYCGVHRYNTCLKKIRQTKKAAIWKTSIYLQMIPGIHKSSRLPSFSSTESLNVHI